MPTGKKCRNIGVVDGISIATGWCVSESDSSLAGRSAGGGFGDVNSMLAEAIRDQVG